MDELKPGESVKTKDGDLLSVGQRVVTSDGMQGAVASVTAKGEGGEKDNEVVRVELDEAVGTGDDKTRWAYFAPDSLRLL